MYCDVAFLLLVRTSGGGSNLWQGSGLANLIVRILECAINLQVWMELCLVFRHHAEHLLLGSIGMW